ncbi:hypothetical protein A33M_2756 [Rhodovulum sp. PH10]|uniref:hypothetical protein n=1 Tax=Rhodovulum sp. PH10 TaxID=1187851 RepID=UPI00027C2673|nr:hypothetical protein [Rhodovulum sp. PH10]EJW11773.1 hypothetical protein A33M_2756 [Rhodovulum sp. PH10]
MSDHRAAVDTTPATPATEAPRASAADVRRILRTAEDVEVAAILALDPTVRDVEEAAVWAANRGDGLGRQPAGKAAAIVDILEADEEADEPPG